MRYRVKIQAAPIIMHNGAALTPGSLPISKRRQLAKSKQPHRSLRLAELDCQTALWLNNAGAPTLPRQLLGRIKSARQGPQVREGPQPSRQAQANRAQSPPDGGLFL